MNKKHYTTWFFPSGVDTTNVRNALVWSYYSADWHSAQRVAVGYFASVTANRLTQGAREVLVFETPAWWDPARAKRDAELRSVTKDFTGKASPKAKEKRA